MGATEILVNARPDDVFALLADGRSYGDWVVGAKHVRDVDDGWPDAGTRIHHTVGFGPVTISDTTEVIEVEPPERLVLEARVRPTGVARIVLQLSAEGSGTRVQMEEAAVGGPARFLPGWLADPLIDRRNDRALRRLKDMAERGSRRSAGS